MHISINDDTFTAQHTTGPTHNMLRLKISRCQPKEFVVTVLPPIGEWRHTGGLPVHDVVLEIKAGLADANAAFDADYIVEAAAIVKNDTRQRGIFEYLTRKIIEKVVATEET